MGSQNFGPPFPMQFRPMVPAQQGQHFMPVSSASQQFHPVGQGLLPGQGQPPQFSQPMQQLQSRPLQPGSAIPSSQTTQMPYYQQNMSFTSGSQQFQQAAPPNNHAHGFGGPGAPLSSSYTFAASSYGQPQNTMNMASQFQPVSQMHTPVVPVAGQPWLPSGSQGLPVVTPLQPTGQQPSAPAGPVPAVHVPNSSQHTSSDWQEFEAGDGRRYYYNKITKQSCWEKPLELMTPLERADASTVWKEFTTAEGRKYYYNKITKQSKWSIPDELKLAREQAEKAATQGSQSEMVAATEGTQSEMVDAPATPLSSTEQASTTVATSGVASSPVLVTPVVNAPLITISGSSATPVENSSATTAAGISSLTSPPAVVPESMGTPVALLNANTTPITGSENSASHDVENSFNGASVQDIEEAKKGMAVAGKTNVTPLEDKTVEDEPLLYASKQEAKNAFKALLESANVEADWNWEQAMRVIINDKRYGALKTLGERKQAFNEYLMQRKKLEAEERRLRQRKAKEEFTKMLEESRELTSSMRWSKAITIFEDDERFKAVERAADREDLFKNYLVDLHKKEKVKAQEEYRQNRLDYRNFLETCGLIKVDTQWRKVQDRLEDDESGSRLEKIDRLEIFQEYIRDLEKEEDEQRKIKKEQIKRVERKNRDEFRKMMEEHVASGTLTAKTQWRDYCQKVKDSAPYQAVALNLSGSTPKDLFEDVAEELQIQYDEDKTHIKDAIKSGKIIIASTWTLEDFKAAIPESIGSPVSDINLQLVFEDLLERVKEKEEKEAKKLQRLAEDFSDKLSTIKEITASSNWEECKQLFEGSSEYRSIREESSAREIFEEYVARLQEKARDKERKREEEKAKKEREREEKEKRKEKERREKEKEKEREREREREKEKGIERSKKDDGESENLDVSNNYGHKEDKKREKDKDRKHRKRHQSDVNSDKDEKEDSYKKSRRQGSEDEKEDSKKSRRHGSEDEKEDSKKSRRHGSEDEKEESKKSRRHGSDRKKSRKHAYTPESDSESKHKRHKRDHRDGSRRNGGHEELEDGELGEDGEIR